MASHLSFNFSKTWGFALYKFLLTSVSIISFIFGFAFGVYANFPFSFRAESLALGTTNSGFRSSIMGLRLLISRAESCPSSCIGHWEPPMLALGTKFIVVNQILEELRFVYLYNVHHNKYYI